LALYEVRLLSSSGNLVRTVRIECANDEEALAAVQPFSGTFPIEVWQGERLVRRFDPRSG
jgi:hypothetical protein